MTVDAGFRRRTAIWDTLSRWEKSELGRDLRRAGLSYGEIMALIPVKKSTLATWCRDVSLAQEQIEAIKQRTGSVAGIPRETNRRRRQQIATIRSDARASASKLCVDPLWVAGIVLYWAEGAKTRYRVSLANTDPRALRLFVRWVRTYINPTARFTLHLHLHEGNDEPKARGYWIEQTGPPGANFHKTFVKAKGKSQRKNHLDHGVCTVKVRKAADAWNSIMEWIDCVSAHFGLDEKAL